MEEHPEQPPVLDPAALADLARLVRSDDPAFLAELLAVFADEATVSAEQARGALARGDRAEVLRLVHSLKGAALQVGARRVQAAASAILAVLRAGARPPGDPPAPAAEASADARPGDPLPALLAGLGDAVREAARALAERAERAPHGRASEDAG